MAHADLDGLTEDGLLAAAGEPSFGRGEDYVRYVQSLRVTAGRATASIQARRVYTVTLTWDSGFPDGDCSCPWNAEGNFCKHLVAVGLAVLDQDPGRRMRHAPDAQQEGSVDSWLESLSPVELRTLVRELAALSDHGERILALRAKDAAGDVDDLAQEFLAATRDALSTRGFIDYRRSFDVARDAQDALDLLDRHLATGTESAADAVRPALDYALKRLLRITMHSDTSSGLVGDALQRAVDLHAQACRQGSPDPVKLAKWLFAFRKNSPGWPDVTLDMYIDAFTDKALQTYRRAVERAAEKDELSDFDRQRMLLELADQDGDVDRAVELLSDEGSTPWGSVAWGAIVQRLRAAGREREAVAWMDRAITAGRITTSGGNEYWLDLDDIADTYIRDGREDEVLALLQERVLRDTTGAGYQRLLTYARRLNCLEEQREWAHTAAVQNAEERGSGEVPIVLALEDGDLARAWESADRWGAGSVWQRLAEEGAAHRPKAAADLYRDTLARDLLHANTGVYPRVAETLVTMRRLYEHVGEREVFDAEIRRIRQEYRRRPSLMAEMTRQGLP